MPVPPTAVCGKILFVMQTTGKNGNAKSKLILALGLNTAVCMVELGGAFWANSLGLFSDALHNLVDETALAVTLWAYLQSRRPASSQRTFGGHRVETLAALGNAALLLILSFGLVTASIVRLIHPVAVHGQAMWVTALVAAIGNFGVAMALRVPAQGSGNIRAAYLHNLSDTLVSLAPVVGGLVIAAKAAYLIDPLISILIVMTILPGTLGIWKESWRVLAARTPTNADAQQVVNYLCRQPGIQNVHDIHLWSENPNLHFLTCQVLVRDMPVSEAQKILRVVRRDLFQRFGICHATIQMETSTCHPVNLYCSPLRRLQHQRQ